MPEKLSLKKVLDTEVTSVGHNLKKSASQRNNLNKKSCNQRLVFSKSNEIGSLKKKRIERELLEVNK